MPDFSALLSIECMGSQGSTALLFKNFAKMGMFLSLSTVYALVYLCGQAWRKRGAVQAMGAFYTLLFLMFAKDAFLMTTTTSVEGPEYEAEGFGDCTLPDGSKVTGTRTDASTGTYTCMLPGTYRYLNAMPSLRDQGNVALEFYQMLTFGMISIIFFLVMVPLFYYHKLRKAAEPSAYLDGNKVCIGQELWSVEFSQK